MKKHILCSLLILSALISNAQETFINYNSNKYFFEGKDLFAQQKFAASLLCFEKFLEEQTNANADIIQEAEYYTACVAYELRKDNATEKLESYLAKYPYTQFEDKIYLMLGNIAFETRRYNLAIKNYEKINKKHISKTENIEASFNQGYAYIETAEYAKAKPLFKSIKGKKTRYDVAATYYASYADYCLKNYDAALDGFLLIEDSPEFISFVPYYIVQIYYFKKEYDKLPPYANKVLELNPSNPNNSEIYRILGESAYKKPNYDEAISYMKKYEASSKKVMREDMYILGMSYFKTNDFAKASTYLAKVTTLKDSLSQNAYLHLGFCYVKLNQKNNARMAYASAADMDFDEKVKEEAAYNYTLSTLETTTPFGESITAFENFITKYPTSVYRNQIYENLVTAYLSSKNYVAASISLSKLSNLSPEMRNVKAYILFQLGTEQFVKGNFDEAVNIFTNALSESSPSFKSAQVYYWRAESYFRLEKYNEARKDYTEFLNKKGAAEMPEYNLANYAIAYTFFKQKNYSEARSMFNKYIKNEKNTLSANYADGLDRLADCYFIARDFSNAEKYYAQSIEKGGKNGDYASFQKAFVQGLQKNYRGKILGLQKLITDFPQSDYQDDAFYEMGRSFVLLDQQKNAIDAYQILIAKYPQAPLARKAAFEIGMLYYNQNQNEQAIGAFKKVINDYPNSEETRTALETLESIYVEQNSVDEFFAYTKTLGAGIVVANPSKEDSLTYLAAERMYMKNNFAGATGSFERYLQNFCDNGRFCTSARFYLADCYYSTDKIDEAYNQYKTLSTMLGNPFMETVLVRLSEIAYDKKEFETALASFKQLQIIAEDPENIKASKIGVLRCSFLLNDTKTTIAIANDILATKSIDQKLAREARFYLTKSYLLNNEAEKALPDLKLLAKDLRTASGAESKYLLANYYFETANDKKAEDEITDFIQKGSSHQYWLARSFILLADIYIKRGDDFQAKQYLLSLQENYTTPDTIQDLVLERLDAINTRQNNSIE